MNASIKLYEALYVSVLREGNALRCVSEIAAAARVANKSLGITGLLIFDGRYFCQQIEGSQKTVLKLLEKIMADPRHENVQVLCHQSLAERRFTRFSLGYAWVENDNEALVQLEGLDGKAAVDAFLRLLPALDLDHEISEP